MSGGVAYVFDEDGQFGKRVNTALVVLGELDADDVSLVGLLLEAHVAHTGSARGRWLLGQGSAGHGAWRKVKPRGRVSEVAAIRDRWLARLAGDAAARVPESVAAAFAAQAPEAMWTAWPETPGGGLALEGEHLLREKWARADAVVLGPGLGRDPETLILARSVATASPVPLVIDADALQPEIVAAGTAPRVLTPHAGEWARIAAALPRATAETVVVRKGSVTRIEHGGRAYHSFFGGPVLARGGSGDVLAGLCGGLLAQTPAEPLTAAARAAVWHGRAADLLARARGQTAVTVLDLLEYLPAALRSTDDER